MEPFISRPRSVCVVIGPFIEWNTPTSPVPLISGRTSCAVMPSRMSPEALPGLVVTTSSGLPRSQPSSSLSPKVWQDEHEASPFEDEICASYRKRRPLTTFAGSGLCSVCAAIWALVARLTTLTELSKRVST